MKSIYILLLIVPLTMACGENASFHQDYELWHCDTNAVILKRQVCDGQPDCSNGGDETIEQCLRKRCADTEYRCAYGACIPAALKCNRHIDCADGSDEISFLCEKDATKVFRQVQGECDSVLRIQCHTGECIGEDQRCDGTVHCVDGSDESVAMCAHLICPSYGFRCAYGACIAGIKYCDGIRDCADGSDEICQSSRRSVVPTGEQSSATSLHEPCRIPRRTPNLRITLRDEVGVWELHYMDHVAFGATIHFSCLYEFRLEGVTELACERGDWFKNWPKCSPPDDQPTCADSHWQCVSGDCIDGSALCNGTKDCPDGSDETIERCIANICADGDYRCAYGACVANSSVCNGAVDCADGSDETRFLCSHNKNELWSELQGNCNSSIIVQCSCGDCITEDFLCDGLAQCPDSSDESVEMCAHIRCPFYAFRCGYGACISGAAICDGIADCLDWSDEASILCDNNDRRVQVELDDEIDYGELNADQWDQQWAPEVDAPPAALVTSGPSIQCTLPLDRPNLLMENAATNITLLGGSKVDPMTVVRYRCVDDWQLVGGGESEAMCLASDVWTSAPPRCEKYCDSGPITRGRSTSVKCYHNQQRVDCSSPLPTGTVAEVQCASGYRRIETAGTHTWLRCDADGEWDYAKFRCTPTCTEPLGYDQPPDKAPYNAAIFKLVAEPGEQQPPSLGHRFECSGAMITPKIVLTAAICLFTAQGQLRGAGDPLLYQVVVGASDSDVYDVERAHNVSEILLLRSESVNDEESFDIPAAVVLADFITMGPTVMPICLDFRKYACYNDVLHAELFPKDFEPGFPHKLGAVAKIKSHTQQPCLVLVGQLTWVILDYFIEPIELQLMRYNYLL